MDNQEKLQKFIIRLENCSAKSNKERRKNKVLQSAKELFDVRKDIIVFF